MKFKKITPDYANFICDKISRFKPAKLRYKTLFDEILAKFYYDGFDNDFDELKKGDIAVDIINQSFQAGEFDETLKKIFINIEQKTFIDDELSMKYLLKQINLSSVINSLVITENTPKNVKWLKAICENKTSDLTQIREKYNLLYPLEGVILCEGQTEYTLLEDIFSLYNINLAKIGLMVIPAGGKNQVARKYYELIEYLKLPIYILLDNDAVEIKKLIDSKLRSKDKLYLIKSGEFEDLIPVNILMNTINSIHNNDYTCSTSDFAPDIPMSHNLDLIYKKYGYGEFKKAQFAKELNQYIVNSCTKEDFKGSEIEEIVAVLFE